MLDVAGGGAQAKDVGRYKVGLQARELVGVEVAKRRISEDGSVYFL